MRRIGLTLLIVVAVVGAGASAHAAGSDVLNRRVSGAVSGVGTAEGAFPRCDISDVDFEHFDLTIDTVFARDSSLSIDLCGHFFSCIPSTPPTCQLVGSGTFVLTLPSGATLNGTVGGSEVGYQVFTIRYQLVATSG